MVLNNAAPTVGGIFNEGRPDGTPDSFSTLMLVNSTVAGNKNADLVVEASTSFSAANSIIVGECDTGSCSSGYNLESPGDTCGFDQGTDQVNVRADDLILRPLEDNGGPTETHAPLPGSAAIGQIPATDCVDADGEPLTTDERGEPRPETDGTMCDVGAFEVQP